MTLKGRELVEYILIDDLLTTIVDIIIHGLDCILSCVWVSLIEVCY